MGLTKNRFKNVRESKLKLSKANAAKFKKAASKPLNLDVEMIQEITENMDVDNGASTVKLPRKSKLTKKRLIRQQKKDEMRKCLDAKRRKSLALRPDQMEGAEPAEEELVVKQKVNEERVRKEELPIKPPSKKHQLKVRAKEIASSNVITGRRMSKKKARKIMNAMRRDEREKERKTAQMDTV